MKLLVAGGTGFIGSVLCRTLIERGHTLIVLTRKPSAYPETSSIQFIPWESEQLRRGLMFDAVVNLAGQVPAIKRWSSRQKQEILVSRINTTRRVVKAIGEQAQKSSVLINASAIGYYGDRTNEELDEKDRAGTGFLADLCQMWEAEAQRAESFGVRVVRLRIGFVLGPNGGALAKMAPVFRCFLGGVIGHGRQWVSWIHLKDVVGLIEWALLHPQIKGALNATAPYPATMRGFCEELAYTLHRPLWLGVPAPILRVMLAEMAEVVLTGQRVLPRVALDSGYSFHYPQLREALKACF